jgi:hypothetical protein
LLCVSPQNLLPSPPPLSSSRHNHARRQVVIVCIVDVVVVVNVVLVVRRAVAVAVAIIVIVIIVVRRAIVVAVIVLPPVAFLANERRIVICFDRLALSSKVNLHARIASGTNNREATVCAMRTTTRRPLPDMFRKIFGQWEQSFCP